MVTAITKEENSEFCVTISSVTRTIGWPIWLMVVAVKWVGQLVVYVSIIGFNPYWLKVSTGDKLPRRGPRCMQCLLLCVLVSLVYPCVTLMVVDGCFCTALHCSNYTVRMAKTLEYLVCALLYLVGSCSRSCSICRSLPHRPQSVPSCTSGYHSGLQLHGKVQFSSRLLWNISRLSPSLCCRLTSLIILVIWYLGLLFDQLISMAHHRQLDCTHIDMSTSIYPTVGFSYEWSLYEWCILGHLYLAKALVIQSRLKIWLKLWNPLNNPH